MKDYICENKIKRMKEENKYLKKEIARLEEQNKKLLCMVKTLLSFGSH